jgi:ATP-binding protein involved in chromosome partitioning
VGILDLDIFGPSIPILMGLQNTPEPSLTPSTLLPLPRPGNDLPSHTAGAIIPIVNHALPAMSMGFLLSQTQTTGASTAMGSFPASNTDTPIVWRGLMVQKAAQQLLFDVDWTVGNTRPALDILVVDMPPGTGDVPLTLGQLVVVDGSCLLPFHVHVRIQEFVRPLFIY